MRITRLRRGYRLRCNDTEFRLLALFVRTAEPALKAKKIGRTRRNVAATMRDFLAALEASDGDLFEPCAVVDDRRALPRRPGKRPGT